MSWDTWIEIETGAGKKLESASLNFTHNCNGMIRLALDAVGEMESLGEDGLYALDGKDCDTVGAALARALAWWEAEPTGTMDEFVPANGCGSVDGAYAFWSQVKNLCLDHPAATLRMSG